MIFTVNAVAFGFIASIWSNSGWPNILLKLFYVGIAIANCALAAPFIIALVKS